MIRATRLLPECDADTTATITLTHADRYRRRAVLTTDQAEPFLLDLAEPQELPGGGALVLDDDRKILIVPANEALTEVRGQDAGHLTRLAWHLGNRHLPVDICDDHVLIQRDHVIEDMLRQLGALLNRVEGPFRPESGAYGHGRTQGHTHSHDPHHDPDAALRVAQGDG